MNPLTIPNLPTDNLYKFYAITGLVISIFSLTLTIIYLTDLQEEVINLQAELEIAQIKSEYLERDNKKIIAKQKKIENLLKIYELDKIESETFYGRKTNLKKSIELMKNNKDWRDYLEFTYKYNDKIFPWIKESDELKVLNAEFVANVEDLNYENIELDRNNKLISKKTNNLYFILFIGTSLIFIGLKLAKFGFDKWNNLVQKPNDERIRLELEKLRTELKDNVE